MGFWVFGAADVALLLLRLIRNRSGPARNAALPLAHSRSKFHMLLLVLAGRGLAGVLLRRGRPDVARSHFGGILT